MSDDILREGDPVHYPVHYTSHPSGIEVIEYTRLLPFGPGNAVKYVMRRGLKGNVAQDLDKALWYLNDTLIEGITYLCTDKMFRIVSKVVAHEPNPLVRQFLAEMYLQRDGDRRPALNTARVRVQDLIAKECS